MADPLSVGAGIAGLVTLADLVIVKLSTYAQAVKGANKEIIALSSEVGALYGILDKLRLISDLSRPGGFDPATQDQQIQSCRQTLEKIKTILERNGTPSAQTPRIESIRRRLRWPFASSEVKTLLGEIDRHKATLGLALNADGFSALLQSLAIQGITRDAVQDIKIELRRSTGTELGRGDEADTRIAITSRRHNVLESFGEIDPSKNQRMGMKLRQEGTGTWLLDSPEYQAWSQTENSMLWLHGIPGAGKTVLAATIIDKVLRTSSPRHAVAFYYCDYKNLDTQKPTSVLGSLVQQLAKQDERCFEKVQSFCDQRNPECKEEFGYDSLELRDLILSLAADFELVTIIVDGLDECGSNAVKVTELLVGLHDEDMETNIRSLLLSRDEVEIRDCLGVYPHVAITAQKSDLRLYVGAEIESRIRRKKLRIKDPSLKEYIMKQLVDGADGMFRWAAYQLDYMCDLPHDSARRKALSDLPPTLNATYERILRSVNTHNKEVQTLVSRVLRWIVHEKSSWRKGFPIGALCDAVSVNVGDSRRDLEATPDETDILRYCSSLVRKSADGDTIELAHFTVKEFLLQLRDEDTDEFAAYRLRPDHDETEIAKVCLTYLHYQDFDQGGDLSYEIVETRWNEYPLRRYAVRNWFDHARDHLDDPELFTLVTQLFSPATTSHRISWAQDYFIETSGSITIKERSYLPRLNATVTQLTALQYASMLALPEICNWLEDRGFDVNRSNLLWTPLHCELLRYLGVFFVRLLHYALAGPTIKGQSVIKWMQGQV